MSVLAAYQGLTRRSLRKLWLRLRPPRRLRITKEGKYYILLTFGVGIAAINTGNNLLYLLLGMLLALIIVSGVMSELSLKKLRVRRRLPSRAQVGRTHLVEIEVRNSKNRVPSYAIEIEDLRHAQPSDKRCFFLKISPNGAQVAAYRRKPRHRGRTKHTGFRIATRFPFGLFEKSLITHSSGSLLVYPATHDTSLPVRPDADHDGTQPRPRNGLGDGIDGVRPMRDGDDARDIYWKKSTTPGQVTLKQRSRETQPSAAVHLDDVRPADANPKMWRVNFEKAVSQAASEAVELVKRGYSVRLETTSGRHAHAAPHGSIDAVLTTLALIQPTTVSPRASTISRSAVTLPPAGSNEAQRAEVKSS